MDAVVWPPRDLAAEPEAFAAWGATLGVSEPTTELAEWTFYDTPDGRLFAGGMLLIRHGQTLRLGTFAQLGRNQSACKFTARARVLPRELGKWPTSPLREAVAEYSQGRALLPKMSCRVVRTTVVIRDHLGHDAVRLIAWVVTPQKQQPTWWVVFEGVRGAAKSFRHTLRVARARGWREAEVEPLSALVAPEIGRQSDAGPDFTAGDVSAGQAMREYLTRTVASLPELEAGVIADIDSEFLHQHRVTLRRARSLVAQFRAVFSPESSARVREILAGWARCSGRLRDLDVWLAAQAEHEIHVPEELRPGLAPLFARIARERSAAQRKVAKRFSSAEHAAERAELSRLLSEAQPGPDADLLLATLARHRIWKTYRRIAHDGAHVTQETPAEAIHEVRIRAKKLRYLLDACGALTAPDDYARLRGDVRDVQALLGAFNDAAVQVTALMARISSERYATATILAVGALIGALSNDRRGLSKRLVTSLHDLAAPTVRSRYRKLFRVAKSPT